MLSTYAECIAGIQQKKKEINLNEMFTNPAWLLKTMLKYFELNQWNPHNIPNKTWAMINIFKILFNLI